MPLTDDQIAKARRQIAEGFSIRGAAARLSVPEATLRYHLNKDRNQRTATNWPSSGDELLAEPAEGRVEIPVIERDYRDQESHFVYPMGDVHKGSPSHNADAWRDWLAYLAATPETSMLGTGDFLNAALKDSASEAYDDILTVGSAKRLLARELDPIKDRIDLLAPGNHEARIYRAVGDDPIEDLADRLGTPYARSVALVRYHVGNETYEIYFRHGTGSGGGVGARANRLQKSAMVIWADAYVTAHTHSQLCWPEDIFHYDEKAKKVVRKKRVFISSGSFVDYEDYAAAAGFVPTNLGAPRLRLDGTRHDLHVSI